MYGIAQATTDIYEVTWAHFVSTCSASCNKKKTVQPKIRPRWKKTKNIPIKIAPNFHEFLCFSLGIEPRLICVRSDPIAYDRVLALFIANPLLLNVGAEHDFSTVQWKFVWPSYNRKAWKCNCYEILRTILCMAAMKKMWNNFLFGTTLQILWYLLRAHTHTFHSYGGQYNQNKFHALIFPIVSHEKIEMQSIGLNDAIRTNEYDWYRRRCKSEITHFNSLFVNAECTIFQLLAQAVHLIPNKLKSWRIFIDYITGWCRLSVG